jgi:dihydrofolate reductase
MSRIIVSNMMSLDGFFEGPNKELNWHIVDEEFREYSEDMLNSIDTILFGRLTYQLMANYWPTKFVIKNDPIIANKMNNLPKIVFSKTLSTAEWNNTRIVKEVSVEEISKLKQESAGDKVILGSGNLISTLAKLGLIDEYWLILSPVILGKGNPLFKDIDEKMKVRLLKAKGLKSGNVILYYQADNK